MTNTARTALIVGHMQPPITMLPEDPEDYLTRLAECIQDARSAGIPVVYAALSYREGYVELPASSGSRQGMESNGMFLAGVSDSIDSAVAPHDGDIIIPCTRVSAFAYTALDAILRSLGVTEIALVGISTGGVVLGTLVDARTRDFGVTVLEDLCVQPGGGNETLFKAFSDPWGATIVTSSQWLADVGKAGSL